MPRMRRRDFLKLVGLTGGVTAVATPWARVARAQVLQALAAGQVQFALGDSNHPLKITEKGKDALMIFATDTRCSYANVVVRKELWDKGVKTVEALADGKLVGRKAVVAATAIGSGTYVYGVYVLKGLKAPDGRPVNEHVEWV